MSNKSNAALGLVRQETTAGQTLTAVKETHVKIVDVHMTYKLGQNIVSALNGVSIDLERGDWVSLCGASGSGKSTLLNLIGCLGAPSKGEIHIAGRNVNTMSDDDLSAFRSTQMGFVFQTFNLLPVLSAVENVEYPLLKQKLSRAEVRKQAQAALELVGLGRFGHHRPDQLSGGQRQRVAIARAFVHRPELIVADEPTANLDRATGAEIIDLLGRLNADLGVTVIIATHDPMVMAKTRRSVQISDGRVV